MKFDFINYKKRRTGCVLLLIFLYSLFNQSAMAQRVLSGSVRSIQDKYPLIGVTIQLEHTSIGTTTDEQGNYELKNIPIGKSTIVFSCVGLKRITKTVFFSESEKNKVLDVLMEDANMQLDGVEVVGISERHEIREIKQQGVPVTVIDGKTLAGRGTSISEVLNHQTGVKLRQTGGVGSQTKINVRGLEGNRVQIYMDGYPLNTPDGNFSINDIPLQFIDRIEIYKGIVPPEFGGDGLGSAVNVVTIDPDKDFYDLAYKMQSYGTHEGSATVRHFFNKINTAMTLYAGGTLAANDYTIKSPYVEGLKIKRDHDHLKMIDYAVSFNFMNGYFDEAELEILGYANRKEMQGIETNIRHTFNKAFTTGGTLHLERKSFLANKLDMKFNGGYLYTNSCLNDTSSYVYDFYGNKRPNSYKGEKGSVPNLSDDHTHDIRFNLNLKYHLIPNKMSVNFNNDFRYVTQEANDPEAEKFLKKRLCGLQSDVTGLISSLSFENKWFNDKLTSVITGRYYHFGVNGETVDLTYGSESEPVKTDRTGDNLGYSIALKYDLPRHWYLKAALEHNYRLPRYEEILGDRITTQVNTALNPEMANNYNLGVIYDHYYNNESRLQFEANVYTTKVKNMMYMLAQAGYYKYQNLGEALLYGADAEVKWDINRNWFVSLNGTWQKSLDYSKYLFGTNTPSQTYKMQLPHIPILYFNWMVDYRKDNLFGGRNQYTRIYYEGGYTDKYYYGYELSKNQNYKIPGTCIHTLGLEYGICRRKIIFGAECHNILNTDEMTNFNYPLAGRLFSLKIRFTSLDW